MRDLGAEVQMAFDLSAAFRQAHQLDIARRDDEAAAEKAEKVATGKRERARQSRRALTLYLVEIRPQWPSRGPGRVEGKTWSEFLSDLGLDDATVRRWMSEFGVSLSLSNLSETPPEDEPPASPADDDPPDVTDTEDAAETRSWEPAEEQALPTVSASVPHVAHNSGNNEWYTPAVYIEAARKVLGAIDLDPASSDTANEVVKACLYHTAETDGLSKHWAGRVWMNPPYASELVGRFAEKLAKHYDSGEVTSAVVLVNNATETAWFATLVARASAVVFPRGRVRFWEPDGKAGAPLQGQALLYLGDSPGDFLSGFEEFGWGALVQVADAA